MPPTQPPLTSHLNLTLQTVPSSVARFVLEVEAELKKKTALPKGSHLLLALSGGADSTALALIFSLLKTRRTFTLSATTLDHGLRSESRSEVEWTLRLAQALNIPCTTRKLAVSSFARQHKIGLEEAGRRLRYQALEEERKKAGADWIVTAHHADDLAEDILMRLVRGSGWPALGGMRTIVHARHLLRPLLFCPGKKLRLMLQSLGLSWCEDQSNADLRFTRNRFRHEIMPVISRENPAFAVRTSSLHQMAELDRSYWEETLNKALTEKPWILNYAENSEAQSFPTISLTLTAQLLKGLHPAARLRLYRLAIETVKQKAKKNLILRGSSQVSSKQLFLLEEGYVKGVGAKTFQLSGGIVAELISQAITFSIH